MDIIHFATAYLKRVTDSVWVHSPVRLNIPFLSGLMRLAKSGKKVILFVPEEVWKAGPVKDEFVEELTEYDGRVMTYDPKRKTKAHSEVTGRFYMLQDGDTAFIQNIIPVRMDDVLIAKSQEAVTSRIKWNFDQLLKFAGAASTHHLSPSEELPEMLLLFSGPDHQVKVNESFELRWRTEGADRTTIFPEIGVVEHTGMRLLSIEHSTTFVLTAYAGDRMMTRNLTVRVSPEPILQYRITTNDISTGQSLILKGDPEMPHHYGVIKGQLINLSWHMHHMTNCHLEPFGQIDPKGHISFSPEGLQTYTFYGEGAAKNVEQPVVINVFPVPVMEQLTTRVPESISVHTDITLPKPPVSVLQEQNGIMDDRTSLHSENWWTKTWNFITKGVKNV